MLYHPPTGGAANDPYVGKTPSTNGSPVPPKAVEAPQREIVAAIAGTGGIPTDADWTQVLQAISTGIYLGAFGGTANALVATIPGAVTVPALTAGMMFTGVITAPNNGPVVLTMYGFASAPGPKSVVADDGSALVPGDLSTGCPVRVIFDGTSFRLRGMALSGVRRIVQSLAPALTGPTTYYVNGASGSDSNDGKTAGTAFATLQKAADAAVLFNLNGYSMTINVANGTYGRVELKPINGSGSVNFVGNTSTPASCSIASTLGSAVRGASVGSLYSFNGFAVSSTAVNAVAADPGCGFLMTGQSNLSIANISFGYTAGPSVEAANGAQITLGSGTLTLTGSPHNNVYAPSGAFLYAAGAGSSIGSVGFSDGSGRPSLVYNTTIATDYFIIASVLAQTTVLFGSISGSGSFSGARYLTNLNAILNTNGSGVNAYPGTSAGVQQTGGQYV